jgi:hypothetical protein
LQSADIAIDAADQAGRVCARIAILERGERERDEAGGVEAGAFGEQIRERANEQGRARDEDQGKGDL